MLRGTTRFAAFGAAACALGLAFQNQTAERQGRPPSEKQLILLTTDAIDLQLRTLSSNPALGDQAFQLAIARALAHIRWLSDKAKAWEPQSSEEGRPIRTSLEAAYVALRARPSLDLIKAVEDDLTAKVEFCRVHGLSATADVIAATKQNGVTEVKGLEVWYIEKFLASDANATPHPFSSFSSPAVATVAPGRYVFWATSQARKAGEKREHCVCVPQGLAPNQGPTPTFRIDLLAP